MFNHLIKNFGPGLKDKADAIASWRLQKNSEGNFLSILDATPTLWFLRFVFVTFFEQLLNGDQTDIILQPCFFLNMFPQSCLVIHFFVTQNATADIVMVNYFFCCLKSRKNVCLFLDSKFT